MGKSKRKRKDVKKSEKSNVVQLFGKTELEKQSDEVIEAYENYVNDEKFLNLSNRFIIAFRHILTSIIFAFLLFFISGVIASLAITLAESTMSTLSMLNEHLTLMFSTSFVTATLTAIVFKSNLYQLIYRIISKILPQVKDTRLNRKDSNHGKS